MAWKRHLKIKSVEEKCWKVLNDLKNDISNKDVFEKYGVLKNIVSAWLKYKEQILSDLEKSSTLVRISSGVRWKILKNNFLWFPKTVYEVSKRILF